MTDEELDQREHEAQVKLAVVLALTPTDVSLWLGHDKMQPLPTGARIRFQVSEHDWFDVDARNGYLYVMCSQRLNIQPEVSNVVTIHLDKTP